VTKFNSHFDGEVTTREPRGISLNSDTIKVFALELKKIAQVYYLVGWSPNLPNAFTSSWQSRLERATLFGSPTFF
jgi:hypothetical protein